MIREEWRSLYRSMRRERRDNPRKETFAFVCFLHGNVHFSARLDRDGLVCQPRIIRDRQPRALVAEELRWARQYRLAAARNRGNSLAVIHQHAARACLGAVLSIFALSYFHALP